MKTRNFNIIFADGDFTDMTLTVEIKETESAIASMREMVEFWDKWEKVLEKNGNDYTKAFLHYLSLTVEDYKDSLNSIDHLIELFSREEGFYPVGESDWFKFIEFNNSYTQPSLDISIKEI